MTGAPEWELPDDQKTMMATAIADVQKHYPVTVIDGPLLDWFNLMQALVIIYGGRLYKISDRKRRERRIVPQAQPVARPAQPAAPPPVQQSAMAEQRKPSPVETPLAPAPMPPALDLSSLLPQAPNQNERPPGPQAVQIPGLPGAVMFPPDHPLIALRK